MGFDHARIFALARGSPGHSVVMGNELVDALEKAAPRRLYTTSRKHRVQSLPQGSALGVFFSLSDMTSHRSSDSDRPLAIISCNEKAAVFP